MGITFDLFSTAYEVAKLYDTNILNRQEAIDKIAKEGMNPGSAFIYLQVYQHLRRGEAFTRTLNADSFDYFLSRIAEDFGREQLRVALVALQKHIAYMEGKKNYQMGKVRGVYEKYAQMSKLAP